MPDPLTTQERQEVEQDLAQMLARRDAVLALPPINREKWRLWLEGTEREIERLEGMLADE